MNQKPTNDERGVVIYAQDRKYVVLRFDTSVQLIGLPKASALELAQNIQETAEMLPDDDAV